MSNGTLQSLDSGLLWILTHLTHVTNILCSIIPVTARLGYYSRSATRQTHRSQKQCQVKELSLSSRLSHRVQAIPESKTRRVKPEYSGLPGVSVSRTKEHLAQNKREQV